MTELPNPVRERLKAGPAGPHPDPDLLTAFAEQALSERERTPVLDHLARCGECREVVALAIPPGDSPVLVSGKDTATGRKAPWFHWHTLRWGALAACVVIVGSAVLLQRPFKKESVTHSVPMKVSVGELQAVTPSPGDTFATADQNKELLADSVAVSKSAASQDGKKFEQHFTLSATNTDSARPLNGRAAASSAGSLKKGDSATLVLQSPQAAPSPLSQPESANRLPEGRSVTSLAAPSPPKILTQTVEVDATAAAVTTEESATRKDEAPGRAKPSATPYQYAAAEQVAPVANETGAAKEKANSIRREGLFRFNAEVSRWTISSDGQLQHSVDSGKTWQPVTVADKATFRALSANGPDIWVGGPAGLLYHSSDAGGDWSRVKPAANGVSLTADIAAIEFTDRQHGKLTTTTGEAWRTNDAGLTWQKQP